MSNGRIRCFGSPFFLKTKYGTRRVISIFCISFFEGVGYHLILSKDINSDANKICQVVQKHIEQAKLESVISAECKILLPHNSSTNFPALFEDLEKEKESLQIFHIGLSETTIEEVFMKVYESKKRLFLKSLVSNLVSKKKMKLIFL